MNVGHGLADDHLNIPVGSNGILDAAVKPGYDTPGPRELALVARRPPSRR